jgi:hypothetical protein
MVQNLAVVSFLLEFVLELFHVYTQKSGDFLRQVLIICAS